MKNDGRIRASLGLLDQEDGAFLEPLSIRSTLTHRVRWLDGVVSVSVPEEEKEEPEAAAPGGETEVRESIRIQALDGDDVPLLDGLPLNYDKTTIRTIEQIDVTHHVHLLRHPPHGRPPRPPASLRDLAAEKLLAHLADSVLEERGVGSVRARVPFSHGLTGHPGPPF